MKERPILFRSEMVRAILAGEKSQTRRIVKDADPAAMSYGMCGPAFGPEKNGLWYTEFNAKGAYSGRGIRCPFGREGDGLWVRETWAEWEAQSEDAREPRGGKTMNPFVKIIYRADYSEAVGRSHVEDQHQAGWRTPRFMPRGNSRLTLKILNIHVERLDEISDQDAIAEGCEEGEHEPSGMELFRMPGHNIEGMGFASPSYAFAAGFRSMHHEGLAWNPWLWVLKFGVVK